MPSRDQRPLITSDMLSIYRGFPLWGIAGRQWSKGEGESGRFKAWRAALQIPISSVLASSPLLV
eukprot:1142307-Pelagomonas_calceolata.AAC.5